MYEYALGKTEGIFQIVRHRGGVMPHQKPRWFPVAPSKKFRLPPQDHIPQSEVDMLLELHYKYRERMAALTQYLWEDYLRNSGNVSSPSKLPMPEVFSSQHLSTN